MLYACPLYFLTCVFPGKDSICCLYPNPSELCICSCITYGSCPLISHRYSPADTSSFGTEPGIVATRSFGETTSFVLTLTSSVSPPSSPAGLSSRCFNSDQIAVAAEKEFDSGDGSATFLRIDFHAFWTLGLGGEVLSCCKKSIPC